MDRFPDGIHVRLRSLVRGAYLYADEDGVGVSLSPRRASLNAAWRVHLVQRGDFHYVLLCSAAYGRYLALSPAMEPPPGLRGRRAVQRDYDEEDLHAVMWRAIGAGDAGDGVVVLRHRGFARSLRANGRYRRWHTCVTVDDDIGSFSERSTMMHWMVEEIPTTQAPPVLPTPNTNLGGPGIISLFTWRAQPSVEPLRTIRYVRVNDHGHFNQHGWATFQFYGRSVYLLICRVLYLLDEPNFIGDEGNFSITVCVQAGIYGRRTPLVIDLPRCEEPMDIFVLTTGSPGENFAVFFSCLFSNFYLFLCS
ncbi:hypothetical protein PAHAL_4G316700 [Panicum hallii]|uniref:Uncharacterized protein n=1 Tax=Panicum hallii TaxID=206008 RepID=A0A2T8JEN5_9POAL|nr:hypothetical protein PAHAL_4G316700 [Panicum hallii]